MSPILGIWASSKAVTADTGAMFPLQVITVGPAGASSVSFTNIPNTYTHLQVRYLARSDASSATLNLQMTHNSDTGSNYSWHRIFGNGSTAGAGGSASQTLEIVAQVPGATVSSNIFGTGIVDILDYANTNKFKTSRTLGGYEDNSGSGAAIQLFSGLWQSTSAITSATFTMNSGNFAANSTFALYAVKAAS